MHVELTAGELSRTPVAALLIEALKTGATGLLALQQGEGQARLYLRNGWPTGCQVFQGFRPLGQCLLAESLIDMETLNRSLAEMARSGSTHGQVLMRMGAISPEDLERVLLKQQTDYLGLIVKIGEGAYRFEQTSELPLWTRGVPMVSPYRAVVMAVSAAAARGLVEQTLAPLRSTQVVLSAEVAGLWTQFGWTEEEANALSSLMGPSTPDEFAVANGLDPAQAEGLLASLELLGLLERADAAAAPESAHEAFDVRLTPEPLLAVGKAVRPPAPVDAEGPGLASPEPVAPPPLAAPVPLPLTELAGGVGSGVPLPAAPAVAAGEVPWPVAMAEPADPAPGAPEAAPAMGTQVFGFSGDLSIASEPILPRAVTHEATVSVDRTWTSAAEPAAADVEPVAAPELSPPLVADPAWAEAPAGEGSSRTSVFGFSPAGLPTESPPVVPPPAAAVAGPAVPQPEMPPADVGGMTCVYGLSTESFAPADAAAPLEAAAPPAEAAAVPPVEPAAVEPAAAEAPPVEAPPVEPAAVEAPPVEPAAVVAAPVEPAAPNRAGAPAEPAVEVAPVAAAGPEAAGEPESEPQAFVSESLREAHERWLQERDPSKLQVRLWGIINYMQGAFDE